MKTLFILMSANPEYWGPIAMTIAAVFCLALIIHTFSGVNTRMNSTITNRLSALAQANPYSQYYTTNTPYTIIKQRNTKLKARNKVYRHIKVSH